MSCVWKCRSPFTRRGLNGKSYGEISLPDTDISFVSSGGRSSTDRMFPSLHDMSDPGMSNPRLSYSSDIDNNYSFESLPYGGRRSVDALNSPTEFASFSGESERLSSTSGVVSTSKQINQHSHLQILQIRESILSNKRKGFDMFMMKL